MFSFLKKPYPYYSFSVKEIVSNFFVGCFVALFLIVFEPFEISIWQTHHKVLKLIGFGLVSFICPVVYRAILSSVIKSSNPEDSWQVWKEVLSMLAALLFIALGNLCFANFIGIGRFGVQQFLMAFAVTLLVGVFPVTANVAIKYNRFLMLNKKDAEQMELHLIDVQERTDGQQKNSELLLQEQQTDFPDSSNEITFISENEKDKLSVRLSDLFYIESADNYSTIVYNKENKLTRLMLRSSLKRLELQMSNHFVIRCHRSYIVNLLNINHVEGNAQGYRISFKHNLKEEIPVSRNYSKALLERLSQLK